MQLVRECGKTKKSKLDVVECERAEVLNFHIVQFPTMFHWQEHLSLEQLRTHLLAGRFRELKWTNTIALALLHLQVQRPS